jgi:parallel beta-helix repeat protein
VNLDQRPFFDKFPLPNTHLVVSNSDIRNATAGILSAAGNLSDSLISGNVTSDNSGNGIILLAGNTDNVIRGNQADRNRNGISAFFGATGNRFEQNSMHGNVTDARDFNTPINVWIDNDCETDNQAGAICGAG